MNNHDFDNIIRKSAMRRKTDVPDDIWEGIKKGKKKRRFPFSWLILFVLFLGAGLIVVQLKKNKPVINLVSATKPVDSKNIGKDKNENGGKDALEDRSIIQNATHADDHSSLLDKTSNVYKNNIDINGKEINDAANNSNMVVFKNKTNNVLSPVRNINAMKHELQKPVNTNNDVASINENIFNKKRNKRNSKGRTKMNVINGAIASRDTFPNENSETNIAHSITDRKPNNILPPASEEPTTALVRLEKHNSTDSNSIYLNKLTVAVNDSAAKNTIATPQPKKPGKQSNNHGLLIEVNTTVAFPKQGYESPLYVKRTLNTSSTMDQFISNYITTKAETAFGFGIRIIKPINKKWSAGVGLEYQHFTELLKFTGVETHTNYTVVKRLVNEAGNSFLKQDTVSTVTKDSTTLNGRNIYNNLSMNFLARYNLITKTKWSCSINAGFTIDLVRKYRNNIPGSFEVEYPGYALSKNHGNTIGFQTFAGLQIAGKLYKKYEWFTEALMKYNLSSYKTNVLSFNKKINMPGISFGIRYSLK